MTVRKFHIAHCPSCKFFSKSLSISRFDFKVCSERELGERLKDSTAIRCKHYLKEK